LPRNFSIAAVVTTLSRLPDGPTSRCSRCPGGPRLPSKLGRLASLEIVNMSGNYLFGAIPRGMSHLVTPRDRQALAVLTLRNNTF
jgi:hypothetical protein